MGLIELLMLTAISTIVVAGVGKSLLTSYNTNNFLNNRYDSDTMQKSIRLGFLNTDPEKPFPASAKCLNTFLDPKPSGFTLTLGSSTSVTGVKVANETIVPGGRYGTNTIQSITMKPLEAGSPGSGNQKV